VNESKEDKSKKLPPATPPEAAETLLRFDVNANNTKRNKTITVECFLNVLMIAMNEISVG
jgi:hypothetical protein